MAKLTQRVCDTSQPPASGRALIRDDEIRGFGLSLTPRTKSYFVECRVKGKQRRVTIGRADLISLEDARTQARKLLADMLAGFDPTAKKREEKVSSVTLIELLEEYVQVKTLKFQTVYIYRRQIKNALKDWLHLPIVDITKNMVSDRHREMSDGCSQRTCQIIGALLADTLIEVNHRSLMLELDVANTHSLARIITIGARRRAGFCSGNISSMIDRKVRHWLQPDSSNSQKKQAQCRCNNLRSPNF